MVIDEELQVNSVGILEEMEVKIGGSAWRTRGEDKRENGKFTRAGRNIKKFLEWGRVF